MMRFRLRLLGAMLIVLLSASLIPPAMASTTDSKAGYIVVGLAPVADFDAVYAYNLVPTTVRFLDHSTGSTPLTYLWDFGDGTSSTETTPSHVYTKRGTYTIKLTVTNKYGSSTGSR